MYTESLALVLSLALAMTSLSVQSEPPTIGQLEAPSGLQAVNVSIGQLEAPSGLQAVNVSIGQLEAPSGLQAFAVSSRAILLSWRPVPSPPSNPLVAYGVNYAPTEGGEKEKEIVVSNTSYVLDSLKPSTNYTFRVIAFYTLGISKPSKRLVQMTGDDVDRPEAPSGLKAVAVSSSAILLSWDPVPSPPSLPIEDHAIHYGPTRGGQEKRITVDNTTSHLIDGLKASTNYTFRVIAYNSKGASSEPSEPVVQMTGEDVVFRRFGLSFGFSHLSPPLVFARRKHPVRLNCTGYYSGNGTLRQSWRYEDKDLTILSNLSLCLGRHSFQHQKRERRSEGSYTCVLRNDVGTLLSTPIQVVLARMPSSFTLEPENQTATAGGQALFGCEIDAEPPATVTWYRNGTEIPRNHRRYTILPSGSLQITGIILHDLGSYKCQCSNIAGVKNSSEAWLTALPRPDQFVPPVFLHRHHRMTAVAGTSAVLECFADGFPKVEYSWKREDGREMAEQRLFGDGNLYFPQVQLEHAGTYVCSANVTRKYRGQIQEESHSIQAFLTVHVPPTFTKVPRSQVVPGTETVRFYCEVESHPASTVYWVKDGVRLIIGGRIKLMPNNTLVVSDTVATDSGIYQCFASNSAGVNTSAARLLVRVSSDRPQAPSGLQAVAVSSNAILLSWEPSPSPPSLPIQGYSIHYAPTLGGPELGAVEVNTSHLINYLQKNTSYTFYVKAFNNKGPSEPSESVEQTTHQ